MTSFKTRLLATAAGLTLAFGGAVAAEAQQPKKTPDDLQTITRLYETKDSKALAALETRLNAERPAGTPRIVYIDPDIMSTWLQMKGDLTAYPGMVAEYLAAKKAGALEPPVLAAVAITSMSMEEGAAVPQLMHPELTGKALAQSTCVVVPYNPNLSADAYMHRSFTVTNPETGDETDALEGVKLLVSIPRQDMEEIVNAREAWGCFDTQFITQVNQTKDFARVMALHRAEVFKDVGGMMQAVKDGADPALIGKFADFRATAASLTTHVRAGASEPGELSYYGSVISESSPALLELQAQINNMGVAKFHALSGPDMVKMATEITVKTSFTEEQASHLMGFAMLGTDYFRTLEIAKAPPETIDAAKKFILETIKRQNDAADRAVRPMTDKEALGYLVPEVTPQMEYSFLQREIFKDPAVQKDANDVTARLRVHRELIDKTRALMDLHPEAEGVIRQVLQGIFNTSPLLEKAPPPSAPASKMPLLKA